MASSVVVKVKYGDTLRRFNVVVNENQQMELDSKGLRAKIRTLFDFAADAEVQLTYIDEDLDMVALVDDEDLHDVVKQGLNPVRITVQLNTKKTGSTKSTGLSTPSHESGQNSNPNMNAVVANLLKSVPEPLREHLSKLSAEVAVKAASTSPVLAELLEGFTKVGQSSLQANPPAQSGVSDGAASKEANGSENEPPTSKDASASVNERVRNNGPAPTFDFRGKSYFVNVMKLVNDSINTLARLNQVIQGPDAAVDHMRSLLYPSCDRKRTKDIYNDDCKRKLRPLIELEKGSTSGSGSTHSNAYKFRNTFGSLNACPFSGLPVPPPLGPLCPPPVTKSSKTVGATDAQSTEGAIFHRGVRCDGCGVLPITGPRFKSKVKDDYDLCRICFEQIGCDADYIRIDFPAPYRHPWGLKGNPMMNIRPWTHPPPPPIFPRVGKHMKQFRPKLDSRFILDVNVMDGTIMAPKTPFTKIWRMRNNGNIPWTHGTQLIWVGGDKFSPTNSVEIEVPVAGFYPENVVDVAVDFIAPELPGRYISYWKMASPSGQKFGQRIWVLIQVDSSLSDATSSLASLNLNLPPVGAEQNNLPQTLDIEAEPLLNVEFEPSPLGPTPKMEKPLVDEQPIHLGFSDEFLYDPFSSSGVTYSAPLEPAMTEPIPATGGASGPILYPTIEADLLNYYAYALNPAVPVAAPTNVTAAAEQTKVDDEKEEILLMELKEMGFKQVDLNKEVLRKNDYNFEQSVDELCNVSEWDLLLEELQGMGFVDREVNKRVLAKNNGSIKHAVMDLITRESV